MIPFETLCLKVLSLPRALKIDKCDSNVEHRNDINARCNFVCKYTIIHTMDEIARLFHGIHVNIFTYLKQKKDKHNLGHSCH